MIELLKMLVVCGLFLAYNGFEAYVMDCRDGNWSRATAGGTVEVVIW